MVRRTSDWRDELGRWLKRFWIGWVTRHGDKCARSAGLRWANATNCTTSLPPGSGMQTPVETELLIQADRLVGGHDAVLVIDDTGYRRKARIRWVLPSAPWPTGWVLGQNTDCSGSDPLADAWAWYAKHRPRAAPLSGSGKTPVAAPTAGFAGRSATATHKLFQEHGETFRDGVVDRIVLCPEALPDFPQPGASAQDVATFG
jgi:hypothetical protein